jgi:hypothetical protein
MVSIDTAPLVNEGASSATSALEPPSEGDSLQLDRSFKSPAQEGTDAFPTFKSQANDPIEDLSGGPEGPYFNDPLCSGERQDPGSPVQPVIAATIHTGVEATAPLVREIDDPGYFPPDCANVLPEPDNGKPEDDGTDAVAEEPASSQTDSIVGRPADLDVTPAPGPETPANGNKLARPKRSSRKTTPNTEVASKRAADREATDKAQRAKAERVEDIVRAIQTKQAQIGRNERAIIPHLVAIGVHLIALQHEAGKGWLKHVRQLGYHPREASRYQKLGASWGEKIGTIGSDFLAKLPTDLKMLEQICRVPVEQLGAFLGAKEDAEAKEGSDGKPRRWDRKRLANVVNDWIGEAPKPPRQPSPEQILVSLDRALSKMASALEQSNAQDGSSNGLRARLHHFLVEAMDELLVFYDTETIDTAWISPE